MYMYILTDINECEVSPNACGGLSGVVNTMYVHKYTFCLLDYVSKS
jgi:hypothetical protein